MEACYEKQMRAEYYYRLLPDYLQKHSVMVGHYAQYLVNYMLENGDGEFLRGLNRSLLDQVYLLGKYHDIGKAVLTEELWLSPRPLNKQEWALVRAHTLLGGSIIRETMLLPTQEVAPDDFWEAAAQCCVYHHERWNGTGYPYGIRETQIPRLAQIISVADAYDAMITDRPYRKGMIKAEALEELRNCAGTQFNPLLVESFCEAVNGIMEQAEENPGTERYRKASGF